MKTNAQFQGKHPEYADSREMFFFNLDKDTRRLMIEEIELDLETGRIFYSARLNAKGLADFTSLLLKAAAHFDSRWLCRELSLGRLRRWEERDDGPRRVPRDAHNVLGEGEFNRYYMRAVCRRALHLNKPYVMVYRAGAAEKPRRESEERIGEIARPATLLAILRTFHKTEPLFGFPPRPNSGLSIRLA